MNNTWRFRSILAALSVIISIASYAQNGAVQVEMCTSIVERLQSGMMRAFAPGASGGNEIRELRTLAQKLASSSGTTAGERQQNAKLLATFLGHVRAERIPNFQRLPVVANVVPPSGGGGPAFSGMNPSAIVDPVARAQYEDAIRKNQENNLMNSRQRELETTDRLTSKYIVKCLAETFAGTDPKSTIIVECIEKAKLSDDEKKEVMAGMNRN